MSTLKGIKLEAATVAGLLSDASARIAAALGLNSREARLEARVLAAFAWNVPPAWLIAHDTDAPGEMQAEEFPFAENVGDRLAGRAASDQGFDGALL